MICVIATATAREGAAEVLREALVELARATRQESGCIQYDVHVGTEDVTSLAVYERWADREALDAHFEEPHTKRFFALAKDLVASPPSIVTYSLADAGSGTNRNEAESTQ
jgi:quinol monooxygenase YgiN